MTTLALPRHRCSPRDLWDVTGHEVVVLRCPCGRVWRFVAGVGWRVVASGHLA